MATLDPTLHERINNEFPLLPLPEGVGPLLDHIRANFTALARGLADTCPRSRELSLAITELDSACRWAVASLVRNGLPEPLSFVDAFIDR